MYFIYDHQKQIFQCGCLPKNSGFHVRDGILPGTWDKPLRESSVTYIPFSLLGRFEKDISFHKRFNVRGAFLARALQKFMGFLFLAHTKVRWNERIGTLVLGLLLVVGLLGIGFGGGVSAKSQAQTQESVELSQFIAFFDKNPLARKISHLTRDFYYGKFLNFSGIEEFQILPLSHAGNHVDDPRTFFEGVILTPAESLSLIKESDSKNTYRLAPHKNCGAYSVFVISEPILLSFIHIPKESLAEKKDGLWFYAFSSDMEINVSNPCQFIQLEDEKA